MGTITVPQLLWVLLQLFIEMSWKSKETMRDERVREVEHRTLSPLVFFTTGGMGNTATVVYKRIALLIAGKQRKPYSKIMHWL